MFRSRQTLARLKLFHTSQFCTKNSNTTTTPNNNDYNLSKYNEQYRQLSNLDFMTATKMLFTDPPKRKKFGIDFHLVQFVIACLPSLAVYFVAQYARGEMKRMDAEFELKKKEEEAKAREIEAKASEEKEEGAAVLSEVKVRLDKLEETVKEIVAIESKKKASCNATEDQKDQGEKMGHQHDRTSVQLESGKPLKDQDGKQKLVERVPGSGEEKVNGSAQFGAFQQDQKSETQNGGTSHNAKR